MSKPAPKPNRKKLYLKINYSDGTYEIIESPSKNIDETIWLFRQLGFRKFRLIERIEKYNFD